MFPHCQHIEGYHGAQRCARPLISSRHSLGGINVLSAPQHLNRLQLIGIVIVAVVLRPSNGATVAPSATPAATVAPSVTPATTVAPSVTPATTFFPTITSAPTSGLTPPSCTLCLHGRDEFYVNQSKAFSIPGLLAQTCGALMQTAELFPRNSPVCSSIRTLSNFCGCPSPTDACTICRNGIPPFGYDGLQELSDAEASQFNIFGAPSGTTLNCETLDSALHIFTANDTVCEQTQNTYGSCCGFVMGGNPGDEGSGGRYPAPTPSFQPCKVCMDGSSIQFPNRTIQLGALPARNCSQLETLSAIIHANDSSCTNLQLLGPYCGCPVAKRSCSFCPNGESVPFPDRPFPLLKTFQGLPPGFMRKVASDLTCGQYQSILDVDPHSGIGIDIEYACLVGQFRSGECGCSQGYQAIFVTWLFRASSILALIGSFFIVRDVMNKPPERRTTYHSLILGTTCFDIITSFAYLFSGILLPPPAYQARGTHATCVLQGVLIQLGLTSLFYSVLLSIYYLLMIRYNWKESRFLKYRKYFHLPIIAIGVALTAAASTSIAPQLGFCYIAIPPEAANRIRITLLFVVPSSVALTIIFSCTALTCYHVYSKERTSLKWSAKRNLSLTKKVCWQSFWYCIGFAVTIPCVMLNYYGDFRSSDTFWLLATASFFAPAQGFLNALIYFHRASKGSSFNLGSLLSCCILPRSKDELPSKQGGPSTGTSTSAPTEPSTVSQFSASDTPGKAGEGDPMPSFIGEIDADDTSRNADDTNFAPEEIGRNSESQESELFSAAAAHWLMETAEFSDEHIQSPRPRPLARSIAVGNDLVRSAWARNRQSVR